MALHHTPSDTLINFPTLFKSSGKLGALTTANQNKDPYHLLPGQTMRVPIGLLKQIPAPAEIISTSGSVKVRQESDPERNARIGEKLSVGAELVTAEDSSAALRFADGSVLVIQPKSLLKLDAMSVYAGGGMADTRLRLQAGRAEVAANPKREKGSRLQVITPSAVAAVRGTEFRVAADEGTAREETLEGKVEFSAAGKSTQLAQGFGSIAEKGKPPIAPVALLSAPDIAGLPAKIQQLPMRFDLPAQTKAIGWIGQIVTENNPDQILLQRASDTPRLTFADLPDGKYVLRVRANDALGLQGINANHAFELDARPFAPLLLSPGADAVVRTAQPEFKWSEVVGSATTEKFSYRIEIAKDADFKDKLLDQVTTERQHNLTQELVAGEYFWRAASVEGSDQGPFTSITKFTYKPAPDAPDLAQSALKFDGKQMQILLPKPAEGLHYEAELAADAGQKKIIWHGESVDGSLQLPHPELSRVYLFVRQVEADGTAGPYATQALNLPDLKPMMLQLVPISAL